MISKALTPASSLPWMPPTELSPVVFRYLPSGSQLILSARPADFLGSKDGQFVLKAGGEKNTSNQFEVKKVNTEKEKIALAS